MAIDFPVGTDFPANGDQIPDGYEHEGFYWDAATGAWKRLCADDRIGDCLQSGETVCDRLGIIENDIIELEEEIDAIAPSVERGVWAFNAAGLASSQGQLAMYDDNYTNVGSPTDTFKNAQSIWLNEKDTTGTPHGFENVEAGNLIELFVEGEPDYGLFEVVEVHDETGGAAPWWVIEVNFVRALSDTSKADDGDNICVKIFQAPSGGDLSAYLPLAGGNMEGSVQFNPRPFNGLSVFGSDGKDYNNLTKIVFRAENGGTYTDPQVIIGVEPTGDTHATTKKYVDDKWDFSQYPSLPVL